MFEFNKPEKKEFDTPKPGQYQGKIDSAELTKAKSSGKKLIKLKMRLEGHSGFHFMNLNMEHDNPKVVQISKDTISSILYGAVQTPPTKIATLEDIAATLTGLPVNVKITEKTDSKGELRTNTYFNDCKQKLATLDVKKALSTVGSLF